MPYRACAAVLFLVAGHGAAAAGPTIDTMCQKNLADGRVLIQDYHVLPSDDATFKVVKYKATSSDGTWSEGPCTIVVTGRAQ